MPHLRLASGNGPAEWFPLQGERVVVGRSRDCDLILPDVLLSRRHVELVRSAEGWLVRDLGSLNGTRLNGARVENEALLRNGDVVEIADWSLAYRESELPSDPVVPRSEERLRDVTELATRSYVETDKVVRQSLILSVLTRAAEGLPQDGLLLLDQLGELMLAILLGSFLVLLPVIGLVGILATRRWAGPLYRFERFLEQLVEGARPGDIRLRDGDELTRFADLLNRATAPLRADGTDSGRGRGGQRAA